MAKDTKDNSSKSTAKKTTKKSGVDTKASRAGKKSPAKKAGSKKTSAAKSASTKRSVKSPKSAVKKSAAKSKAPAKRSISPEEHYHMVQTAAYFRAQRDGFSGDAMNYWIQAEQEVDEMLKQRD